MDPKTGLPAKYAELRKDWFGKGREQADAFYKQLDDWTTKSPQDGRLRLIRGMMKYAEGYFALAKVDLAESVRIRPTFLACWLLADYTKSYGDYEESLSYLSLAIRRKLWVATFQLRQLYKARAEVNYRLRRYDAAIEDCLEWWRLNERKFESGPDGTWLELVALCHMKQKRWREAAEWYTKLLADVVVYENDCLWQCELSYLLRMRAWNHFQDGDDLAAELDFWEAESPLPRKKPVENQYLVPPPPPKPELSPKGVVTILSDLKSLDRWWRERRESGGGKPKLIVIATSGGGIAAAQWTTLCLTELEKRIPNFPNHVRIVTGASGGMVGAAHYVTSLGGLNSQPSEERRCKLRRAFGNDFLSPILRRLTFRDIPSIFCPVPQSNDRGQVLDKVLAKHTEGRLGQRLVELRAGESHGWRPSLIISPTILDEGKPLIISNLVFDDALDFTEFRPWFPAATKLTLATALRMNAAFPYVTPAVTLPTNPPRRIVDAGYLDNSGVGIAAQWILHHRDWLNENTSGVALIQIQTYPAEGIKKREESWLGRIGTALQTFTSPLEGFAAAKAELVDSRNLDLVNKIKAAFSDPEGIVFEPFELKCKGEYQAPLSWRLSQSALERLNRALEDHEVKKELHRIEAWMGEKKP